MTSDEDTTLMTSPARKRRVIMALLLGAVGFLVLPFAQNSLAARPASPPTVKIGVKNFAEEQIMADMYQLLLQKAGFSVSQHVLGETPALQAAMLRGDIDLYPEYTGTGLGILNANAAVVTNSAKAYAKVKAGYEKRFHITWLKRTPMNDTNGVGVTQATSAKYKLHTLSDLAKVASKLTFADDPGCRARPDCLGGFKKYYHINFKSITDLGSTPLRYSGLKSNQFDAVEVFTTDAPIQANHVVVLADNKHKVFPADNIAPIVRDSTLKKYPKIKSALNPLAHLITTPVMIGLNGKVILQSKDPMTVARNFLKAHHLI